MKNKIKICSGLLAAITVLPGYALAYQSNSDTGVEILDYIETERNAARENALDPEQKQLIKDSAEMQAHLKQPIDPAKAAPVAFEGDDLSFDERTGAVYAKGNVRITQIGARMTTDEVTGNTKSKDVYIDDKAHMLQTRTGSPHVNLDGYKTQYNYGKKTGQMENAVGKVDRQYVTGKKMEFYPDEVVIYNGTATKSGAKKPVYHSSAEKIEIWPNHKMILTNVKFWIGNKVIYKKDKYIVDISPGAKDTIYPKFGYDSDDGAWVNQSFDYMLTNKVRAYANLTYYTKQGFANVYGTEWNNAGHHYDIEYGNFEDSNNNWIKKEPTFHYKYGNHFATIPFSYAFNAEIGRWYNKGITSTHKYGAVSISRDVLHFGPTWDFYTNVGYSITRESYDHSDVRGFFYDFTLVKKFNPKWAAFTGYHYSKNSTSTSLFHYDVDDYSKKLEVGFSYRFDDKNRIVVGENFDMDTNKLADTDYFWYHDIARFAELVIRYRGERNTWHIGFEFTPW
jgi:hypothetical protein